MNELQATTTQNEVTQSLLMDYLKTITDSLDDAQRMQFCAVAKAFNLNPFKREIYATTYKDKNTGKTNMSIVVGYEVYLKRAEMNPNFDGFETEFRKDNERGICCTCTVYRKDRQHPTKSTVYMNEYSTGRSLWNTKPMVMLEKVAICTAFRRSFPTDFGGIPYAPEELSQTTEEKLQQQGLTEVATEVERVRYFIRNCASENPAVFENFKNTLKNHGWAKPSDIPEDKLDEVKKMWTEAVELQGKFENLVEEKETENG